MSELRTGRPEEASVLAAAMSGDRTAFGEFTGQYRKQLQVHCYRMVGSIHDAEDMVQETFLRAWNRRDTFERRASLRNWLYRIATNACLDLLDRRPRQPVPHDFTPGAVTGSPHEIPWLQPIPDLLLDGAASATAEPQEAVIAKETIELAFLVAIQHLPPKQRAALVLRDILGWPAKDAADLLEMTVASVNSALQRARPAVKEHLPPQRTEWAPDADPNDAERELLRRYMDAHERIDFSVLAGILREDARLTMPPAPALFGGRGTIVTFANATLGDGRFGEFRLVATRANRQPAAAKYLRGPGDDTFRAQSLDVLRVEEGLIAEITTFHPDLFPVFGLPDTLPQE
jgi:RNA polymerase sigma-70 factor (ECF subfamily)